VGSRFFCGKTLIFFSRAFLASAFQGREISPKVPVGAGLFGHEGFSWLTGVVRDENVG
jgi:hypothetical protein